MQRSFSVVLLVGPAALAITLAPEGTYPRPDFLRSDVKKCNDDHYGLQCESGIAEFPYCRGGWGQIDRMIGQMSKPGYRYRQKIAAKWLQTDVSTVLDLGAYVNPMSNFLSTKTSKVRDVVVVDPLSRERDVDKSAGHPRATLVRALFEDVFLANESVIRFDKFDKKRSAMVFMGMAGCYGTGDSNKSLVRAMLSAVIPHFKHLIVEYADGAEDDNCRKCWKHIEDTFVKTGKYSVVKRHNLNLGLLGIKKTHLGGGPNRLNRHMLYLVAHEEAAKGNAAATPANVVELLTKAKAEESMENSTAPVQLSAVGWKEDLPRVGI